MANFGKVKNFESSSMLFSCNRPTSGEGSKKSSVVKISRHVIIEGLIEMDPVMSIKALSKSFLAVLLLLLLDP